MLKKLVIIVSLLVVLLIGAAFVLPSLIPSDVYKTRLEAELSRSLARDVQLNGEVELQTFPIVRVSTGRVDVANPEGFGTENFLSMDGLEGRVKLWPLLSKRVEIAKFTLDKPEIALIRKADGSVNWAVGDQTTTDPDAGPFKRDGRFTEFDPSLDAMAVRQGRVTFSDEVNSKTYVVDDINVAFSLPGLARPLTVEGNAIYDGILMNIDGQLDNPEAFLNGAVTSFSFDSKSDIFDIKTDGDFRSGEDIALDGNMSLETKQAKAVLDRLPVPSDLALPPLQTFIMTGKFSHDPSGTAMSDLKLNLEGQGFLIDYTGEAGIFDEFTGSGNFSGQLTDNQILKPYLPEDFVGGETLQNLTSSGRVTLKGKSIRVDALEANIDGDGYAAKFTGNVTMNDSVLTASGPFEVNTPNISDTLSKFGQDVPEAKALKDISAKGKLSVNDGRVKFTDMNAVTSGGIATGTFRGDGNFDETLSLAGQFDGQVSSFSELDALLPQELPYAQLIGKGDVTGTLNLAEAQTTISDLTATLSDGEINGRYTGGVTIAETTKLAGDLSIDAANLRRIAELNGTALPPNPESGAIFTSGAIKGRVSGTPERMIFDTGQLSFDGITGTGDFTLETTGAKPILRGTIALSALDIRPYMDAWSAQRPQGEILPWSEQPINLSGLRAIDADIKVKTPSLKMSRLEFGDTSLNTTLTNGVLDTKMSSVRLYDGSATGSFRLDASNDTPRISLTTDLLKLNGGTFLASAAGFDRLTGLSDMTVNITGQGRSQAAIMKSLTGSGNFSIFDGRLNGIDTSALLTGLDQALTSRQIPDGLGLNKNTTFQDLVGKFNMKNGVASLDDFELSAGNFGVSGGGKIDIGNQTIDFSFRPRLNDGSGIAGFGVPLQFSGGFGEAKAGLDADYLTQIIQARAKEVAEKKVRGELDKVLGGLGGLGGLIGGETPSQQPSVETPKTPDIDTIQNTEQAKEDESEVDDEAKEENAAETILDLFGRIKKETTKD